MKFGFRKGVNVDRSIALLGQKNSFSHLKRTEKREILHDGWSRQNASNELHTKQMNLFRANQILIMEIRRPIDVDFVAVEQRWKSFSASAVGSFLAQLCNTYRSP